MPSSVAISIVDMDMEGAETELAGSFYALKAAA